MKILLLLSFLSLSGLCNAQQIASPNFVPTWQPKFNLYNTDTITNINTTLQPKKYEAMKVRYKSTVVGSDLRNAVDHDLNFNVGAKFLSGTLSASVSNQKVYGSVQDYTSTGLSFTKSSSLTNVSFNVFQTNQFKTNTGQNGTVANLDMTIKF
jgi:hypothetical protein